MYRPPALIVLATLALSPIAGSAQVVETELAGKGLLDYPYFEYVRAFNETGYVAIAVDPSRLPAIAGVTADLYVVEAKNSWNVGDALVDVSAALETFTFVDTSVADNRALVALGGELEGDAGTDIGVGYDVVIDADRDAHLSDGDYLDGADENGITVFEDLVEAGPLPVSVIDYDVSGLGSFSSERTWYPTNLVGQVPLIVISHGNGHDYDWYDYLQQHLASFGYIVMSHENNTSPGPTNASTTTLQHTDAIIEQQDVIGGGVLDGHIDTSRIVWIGHSRGGEGVAIAYNRIVIGDWDPAFYELGDIRLVSSIAPTDFGSILADPHEVNYHVLYGSADGDVSGAPDVTCCWPFAILDRSEGYKSSHYVHGADHNDFNCCGFNDFSGPPGTEIGRSESQRVAKAVYLALVKHYVEGNVPAQDYLWRQWERFRPIGVASGTTVVLEYSQPVFSGKRVIDDFQTMTGTGTSSSGGSVTFTVDNLLEGIMRDSDFSFTWTPSEPWNGMTRNKTSGTSRGVVFDFDTNSTQLVAWEVLPALGDVSAFDYLSFRAAQGTRHPDTIVQLRDESWIVGIRDGDGDIGLIDFSVYGGGIEEPYQRTGDGSGAGWQNEFETIRIRLTDFQADNPDLDLDDISDIAMGFLVGEGSSRIGLDDLEFTFD